MRYVIYGAGAVGGVVGGNLRLAGLDVTLVARGANLEAIRDRGLVLDRADGRHTVQASATDSSASVEWDAETIVLLAVKSQHTSVALADLAAWAPASTPVVSLQNGVANERKILRRFARTYSICVMAPTTLAEPGVVVQHSAGAPAILDIGRYPTGTDAVASAIVADFGTAAIVSEARSDIMPWKYRKLIQNLSNGVDAACGRGEPSRSLTERVQSEGEAVLGAAGISVVTRSADRERRGQHLEQRSDPQVARHSSTWQSLARQTGNAEVDYFCGEIVLLGRLNDVPTPANELVQHAVNELARTHSPPGSIDPRELLAKL